MRSGPQSVGPPRYVQRVHTGQLLGGRNHERHRRSQSGRIHRAPELPREAWPHWNQGWPRESEAALLDAIFSSRAAYGTPKTGVRAVVDRWRTHRSVAADDRLDSLPALAAFTDRGDELATILGNRQRVPGNYFTKAEGAARAAKALVESGCRSSADVEDTESLRSAVVSVPGLGPRTFETLMFLSGRLTVTSIDLLARFATEASSSEKLLSSTDAAELLVAVAETSRCRCSNAHPRCVAISTHR